MRVKFLGTGTSTGVPEIGCKCEVCTSTDIRNRRLRASVLLDTGDTRILIDCGPDFRQQIMNEEFSKLHGLLLTHEHYDHVGGIDDLRPFCRFDDVDIYANEDTLNALKIRMPYSFREQKYPGVPSFNLHETHYDKELIINDLTITPIKIMHHLLPIMAYRIGSFAYITDAKYIPEEEYIKLKRLDTLVINTLRLDNNHLAHMGLSEALAAIEKIAPRRAYLTHMSHRVGLHEEVEKMLPDNVHLAYDGLQIEIQAI